MVIKRYFILFSILSLLTNLANAQEVTTITGTNLKDTVQSNAADTIPMIEIEDLDLDNIISLRAQFEKQNQSYSAPVTPNENLLRFLKKRRSGTVGRSHVLGTSGARCFHYLRREYDISGYSHSRPAVFTAHIQRETPSERSFLLR